jgi:hypothetical protein
MVHVVLEKCASSFPDTPRPYKSRQSQGIFIAESGSGLISRRGNVRYSLPTMSKQIVSSVQDDDFMVGLHNCGNTKKLVRVSMLATGALSLPLIGQCCRYGRVSYRSILKISWSSEISIRASSSRHVLRMRSEWRRRKIFCGKVHTSYSNYIPSSGLRILYRPERRWPNIQAYFHGAGSHSRRREPMEFKQEESLKKWSEITLGNAMTNR